MTVLNVVELVEDRTVAGAAAVGPARMPTLPATESLLRSLSATSEGFAYGSTALAAALTAQRQATIVANVSDDAANLPKLSCWRCRHDERGLDLVPFGFDAWAARDRRNADDGAARLVADGGPGDVLIACDPWGDSDLLCRALRIAAHRGMTTVAITSEQPNLLAALASHAVRVPVTMPYHQELVATALRYLVQTAGGALESRRRQITQPLGAGRFS